MTTQKKTIGGQTPEISYQNPMEILAAAQALRSEAVGKYLASFARHVRQALQPVLRPVDAFFTRRREMTELMGLSDHELADIGLSRGDLFAARRTRDQVFAPANENIPRSVA